MSECLMYNGGKVCLFQLRNSNGMCVEITNFGARIVSIIVPDALGVEHDVVLGFDLLSDYLPENHESYFGALVGRYANRIANGRFTVNGKEIQLPCNDGPNCLHGGPDGWQYRVFDVKEVNNNRLTMTLESGDDDNGFPGNVRASVTYTLGDDNSLRIDYHADVDSVTPLNLTNHSYFNLNGNNLNGIGTMNHFLEIDADSYLPVNEYMIPTGEKASVDNTVMDFRKERQLGDIVYDYYPQTSPTQGLDHCWILNHRGDLSHRAAYLEASLTGIWMEVYTTEPGLHVYTGNFLDGVVGKNGIGYVKHYAVSLETQQYPDSPNRQWAESPGIATPDKPYESTTIFKFGNRLRIS